MGEGLTKQDVIDIQADIADRRERRDYLARIDAAFPEPWGFRRYALCAGLMGSKSHGTYMASTDPTDVDDVDIQAVIVPPREAVLGLETWEHWVWQQDEMDVVAYSLRKWVKLILKSNPNVVGLLWLPNDRWVAFNPPMSRFTDNRDAFLSKKIYDSFCGYAASQLHGLGGPTGRAYQGAKRKDIVIKYGYDLKHAAHCVRLLRMGTEALETGVLHVDRSAIDADELKAIKRGEWPLEKVKDEVYRWQMLMDAAFDHTRLRDEPDYALAERLMLDMYEEAWG